MVNEMITLKKLVLAAQVATVFVIFLSVPSFVTSVLMVLSNQAGPANGAMVAGLSLFSIVGVLVSDKFLKGKYE